MSKSVIQLNPKAKQTKKKFNYLSILIIVQFLLTVTLIILGIVTIIKNEFLYIFELILGITLIIMGINNHIIYKRKNLTILYFIIGIGSFILAILKMIGL